MNTDLLRSVRKSINEFGLNALRPNLEATADFLNNSQYVPVAVFGRFKAGKSSFINTLVKQQILPVGVVPVTAIITKLRFGPEDKAVIHFFNESSRTVPINEISTYVSEKENPENKKKVVEVDIELSSLKYCEGLEFIDTPGLGSVFRHNTNTTLNWLPRVGVALVAVSVDPPLSEHDVALIRELQRLTPRIAVLLTKADLVSAAQLSQIIDYTKLQLRKELNNEFEVWPFSTLEGQSSLQQNFISEVLKPLVRRKDSEAENIKEFKLNSLRDECLGLLKLALNASQSSDDTRARLRTQIIGEKNNFYAIRDEFQMLAREHSGRTRPFIFTKLLASKEDLESTLNADLKAHLKEWRGSLWALSRQFETWLEESFHREMSALSIDQSGTFIKPLKDFQSSISRAVQGFQLRLASSVKAALNIDLKSIEFIADIKVPASPDVSFSRLFDSHIDILSFMIPVFIFRPLIERHFINSLRPEIEKNLSRLASQWTETINRAIFSMQAEAEKFVKDQLKMVDGLLNTSASATARLIEAINVLDAR